RQYLLRREPVALRRHERAERLAEDAHLFWRALRRGLAGDRAKDLDPFAHRADDLRGAVVVAIVVRQRTEVDHARRGGPIAVDRRADIVPATRQDARRSIVSSCCSLTRNVARYLDIDRTASRLQRLAKRAIDDLRGVRRTEARLPFRDRREERAQVELLMRR